MSKEAWIFLVGFRVFDVGLLIVWLVWFFRLRDEGSDPPDDEGGDGGSEPDPRPSPSGGGTGLPTGRVPPGGRRPRDGHRAPPGQLPRRGVAPVRSPLPARVRSPGSPARITRRA